MKKILVSAVSAVAALAFALPALAANPLVADHSKLVNINKQSSNTIITVDQSASVSNNVNNSCNTGANSLVAGNDLMKFGVSTGDANCTSLVNNSLNNVSVTSSSAMDTTAAPMPATTSDVVDHSKVVSVTAQDQTHVVGGSQNTSVGNSVTNSGNTGTNYGAANNDAIKGGFHTGTSTTGSGVNTTGNNFLVNLSTYVISRPAMPGM